MKKKQSIIFMGTPAFAVPALIALHKDDYQIISIVTQPDSPVGRKREYIFSPIKQKAIELGISIFQPEKIKDDSFIEKIKTLKPDCIVVVAYGKIIPPAILAIPRFGCVNVHASLLPRYRGASPIQTAILNGETQTGVTIMRMDQGMDTGPIIGSSVLEINPEQTSQDLYETLSIRGAKTLIDLLPDYLNGKIIPIEQDNSRATYTKIISKEDGRVNWNKNATSIYNAFRAYYPWPGAYSFFEKMRIKLLDIQPIKINDPQFITKTPNECGTIIERDKRLFIQCGENTLIEIKKLQVEGKSPLLCKYFIHGYKPAGKILS